MRVWRVSVAVALTAAFLVVPPVASQATPGFIDAQGTQLTLDGDPFRFTGLNVYNANSDGWCWFEYSDAEFHQALTDMGPGVNVIRAWFFQPLATTPGGQRDWSRFDRTLQIAGQHGVRVIVTLTDQWGECGATGTNPFKDRTWYESGYETEILPDAIVPYRDWVSEVVTRYQDDPNVAFWQLINEAEVDEVIGGVTQACPPGNEPADILRSWAQDVGGLVKSIDSNHLVSLGTIGNGQCGAQGAQYGYVHDIPEIDLCEYHDYGSPNVGIPGDQFNGLQVRLDQCAAIDKPLFIGEAGIIPDDVGGTLQDRADAFAEKMDAQFDAGVVGFLAWAWSSLGSTTNNYDVGPGDPTLDTLGTARVQERPEILQLSAGGHHACFVTAAGAAKCWGYNASGQLGDGSTNDRSRPVQVVGLDSGIAAISSSLGHTCALTVAGGVKCWGLNDSGQLGDGTTIDRLTPTDVEGLTSGVVSISTGSYYTCALTSGGGAKCWGANWNGQLGDGSAVNRSAPVDVSGLTSGVAAIAGTHGAGAHTCALTESGQAKCWGRNSEGQLGDGSTYAYTPTSVNVSGLSNPVAISLGMWQTCALTLDTGMSCWGGNFNGQLGDGTITERHAPTDVTGLSSGIAEISAGHMSTCAVSDTGGARCWGSNGSGQLGDGTATDRHVPTDVSGLTSGVARISTGYEFACALMEEGTVKCWGSNNHGQLGRGWIGGQSTVPEDVDFTVLEPDAPTNVQATAGDGEATVAWSPPASDGGSDINGYTVTSEPDGVSVTVGPGATQAVVTGLTNGTSYTFTVVATNVVGDGPPSAPSNAVTPHAIDPPTAPRNPVATASDRSATVTWLVPTSDGGGSIMSYTVSSNLGGFSVTVAGTELSATIDGLTNGTAYRFRVVATNAAGDGPASVLSNAVTPRAVPGSPTNVVATPGPGRATVSWTPPASNGGGAINGYILTASSSSGNVTKTVAGGATATSLTGLTNGVTYSITIVARNVVGTGPPSTPVNVTPAGVPNAPTGVVAVAGNGSASITWLPPAFTGGSPLTSYTVTSNVGGFTTAVIGSQTNAVINGLSNGVAYRFRVFATNAVGNGPVSAYSLAVTPRGVPGAPTGVSASPGNTSATVNWTAPASTGGSPITDYVVTSSGGHSTTVPATARSALVSGLTNGVGYTFTVVARNAIGDGPPGTTSTPVTPSASVTPIVFSSNRTGSSNYDIYLMNPDGSGLVRIVGRAGPDQDPAISPDGTKVVFVSGSNTALELWMVNIDGTGLTQLTCNTAADRDPNWSPDGSQIVFQSLRDGTSDYEIYVMTAQACGTATRLTDNGAADTGPSFSPDGSRIVFSSDLLSNQEIWVMNADGSSQTRLTTRTGSDLVPQWSPDGSRIAWTAILPGSNYHVWVMDADGQNPIDLTTVTFGSAVKESAPAWSPTGTQILFASTRDQSPNYDVYKMQADGTGVIRLTTAAGNDAAPDW